jgi:hypothetical protein
VVSSGRHALDGDRLISRAETHVKIPQDHLNELGAWFRTEAENLPDDVKRLVIAILDTTDSRAVCHELARLRDAGRIPASWKPQIDDLCGRAF